MNIWLAVFIGGGAGSTLRYALSRGLMVMELKSYFPWATLASNLLATVLLAFLMIRMQAHLPGREQWLALLVVGFCGGFSTMSTFNHENFQLLRDGLYGFAAMNILVSVLAGILIFYFFARTT